MPQNRLKNSARWCASGARPLGYGLLAVAAAFGLRYALHPVLQQYLPFFTFVVATLLVEFAFGIAAASVVIVLSPPLAVYFFVRPFGSFDTPQLPDVLLLAGNVTIMVLGALLIESLQRARYRARLLGEVARARYDMLLRADRERFAAQESARASHERFAALVTQMPEVWYLRRVDGSFEYVKSELYSLTGAARGSLAEGGWLSVMHPEDAADIAGQISAVAETGERMLSSFRLRLRNGEYAPFEGYLTRTEDEVSPVLRWEGGPVTEPAMSIPEGAVPA